jgi:hypothetical protein
MTTTQIRKGETFTAPGLRPVLVLSLWNRRGVEVESVEDARVAIIRNQAGSTLLVEIDYLLGR